MNQPQWYNNRITITAACKQPISDQPVCLAGFLRKIRKLGKLCFVNLVDTSGDLQLVISPNLVETVLKIPKESVIAVYGSIQRRKAVNSDQILGEWEMVVTELFVLNYTQKPTPFVIDSTIQANEETKLTYRYLEMRSALANNIKNRSKIINLFRQFLLNHSFIEVDTPILGRSTPEGARDYLVPTRNKHHPMGYALPQSPQLYKQLLMIGGLEKYFQVAKNFRDEDLRADRQPEFTQLDLECSFTNTPKLMALVESMFAYVWEHFFDQKLSTPFQHISYHDCINLYGTDKPDVRFATLIEDWSDAFKNHPLKIFDLSQENYCVKGLFLKDHVITKKYHQQLEFITQNHQLKGIMYATQANEQTGSLWKLAPEWAQNYFQTQQAQGTILMIVGPKDQVLAGLGAIRNQLGKDFSLYDRSSHAFLWVTDWPLFEWNSTEQKYDAAHHPFTHPASASLSDFDLKPQAAKADAYDLVLNGIELGSGSKRITDKNLQQRMFAAIGLTPQAASEKFGWFLEAFAYGTPPHQGIGLGVDRIIQIMLQTETIRDVIAFPKNNKGIDQMQQTPAAFEPHQLAILALQPSKKDE